MLCFLYIAICTLRPTLGNDIETLMTNNQKHIINIYILSESNNWDEFCNACSDQSFISSLQLLRENIEQEYQFQSFIENIEDMSGIADVNRIFLNLKRCLSSTILANYLSDMQTEPIDKIPHNVTLIVLNLVTTITKGLDSYNDELSQFLPVKNKEQTNIVKIFSHKYQRLEDLPMLKMLKEMFLISQKYTELLQAEVQKGYICIKYEYADKPNKDVVSFGDLHVHAKNLIGNLQTNIDCIFYEILRDNEVTSFNFLREKFGSIRPIMFLYSARFKFVSRKLVALFTYIQIANSIFTIYPELEIVNRYIVDGRVKLQNSIWLHIVNVRGKILRRNAWVKALDASEQTWIFSELTKLRCFYDAIENYVKLTLKELSMLHKCTVETISLVMTWDGIVTEYHNVHVRKIGNDSNAKAYIQSIVLNKTLEAISFDYRRHNDAKGIRRRVAIAEALLWFAALVNPTKEIRCFDDTDEAKYFTSIYNKFFV